MHTDGMPVGVYVWLLRRLVFLGRGGGGGGGGTHDTKYREREREIGKKRCNNK